MADLIGPDGAEYEIDDAELPAALDQGYRLKADVPVYEPTPQAATDTSGPGPGMTGRMVDLIGPDGKQYEVDEAEAPAAMEQGYKQGLLDKAYGAVEAGLRGITSGATDLLQTATAGFAGALGAGFAGPVSVTGPEAQAAAGEKYAEIQARKERTGGLATGLELGGAVGTAILSGGTSSAASAARYTPVGAINSLATRAASAFGAKTAVGRIGATAAAGALESAMDSASRRVIDDLAAGNYEISAERMAGGLAQVVDDAAIGALAGGAIGGLIEGTAAAARAAKGLGKSAVGLLGKAEQAAPTQTVYKIGLDDAVADPVGVAERMGPLNSQDIGSTADNLGSDMLRAARGAADSFGDTQQGAVKSISKDLQEFFTEAQDVRDVAGLAAKREWIKTLDLGGMSFDAALSQIDNTERLLKDRMDNIPAEYLGTGGALLKQAESAAGKTRQLLMDVYVGKADPADALVALDQYKSFLQRGSSSKSPMVRDILKAESENWRLHLEDSNIYGAFGEGQKKLNRPIYEGIAAEYDDSIRAWSKQGSEQSEFDPFLVHKRPNEQHIGGFLNSIGKNEIRGDEEALRKFLRLKAIDAQTRADIYGSPMLQEKAAKIAAAAGRIEDTINAVAFAAKDKKAWDEFSKNALVKVIGGDRVGGIVQVGSAIRKAAKSAAEVESALASAVEGAVRTTLQVNPGKVGAIAGATAGAIKRAIQQSRDLENKDSAASARLRLVKQELQADDPVFADAADLAVKARAKFLSEKAGPVMDSSDPLGPRPPLQNRTQQAALQRYADAAVKPAAALRRLGAGIGTAEDIETLRTLYPALYADFVQRVQAKIQNVNPTVKQRQNLQRITGVPATRVSAAWLQQVAHAPEEQPMPAGPAPGGGGFDPDRVAVASDRIMNGE